MPDGKEVAVRFRYNKAAKRLILRFDATRQEVIVTLPALASQKQGWRFVEAQSDWIITQMAQSTSLTKIELGAIIPVEGIEYKIAHNPDRRSGADLTEASLLRVAGPLEHLPRRTKDFLKKLAKQRLQEKVAFYCDKLGVTHRKITVRDTKSRWGSCAANGNLNFSWRLIMAPSFVLNYVVAHEVAHIREHNHSKAFWTIVAELDPDWKRARDWLNQNGAQLHSYQ